MVLEATLICLDNSEWMRNGDYAPTRLDSQYDAASIICNDRTTTNPENTVGIISMAGKGVELLVSPTEDIGKILACFAKISIGGKADFSTTVQIAQLALKHRKNKNGGQRIVAFVGSPVQEPVEILTKIAKQLKKNNVAVDVISIGEVEENQTKLTAFVDAVSSNENSHLINVPPGVAPADALLSSPLMQDSPYAGMASAGAAAAPGGSANFDEFGGIDPSLDPELAMAIRVSTEEARAQEEQRAKAAMEESKANVSTATSASANAAPAADDDDEDEAALIRRALELSMRESDEVFASSSSMEPVVAPAGDDEDMDEDEALRRALELSMVSSPPEEGGAAASTASNEAQTVGGVDADFLNSLLGSSDVDLNDPIIQAALAQLSGGNPSTEEKTNRKRKNEDDEKES